MTHLTTLALTRLCHDFPSTLEERDKFHSDENRLLQPYRGIVIDVINLARECGLFRILPAAFARCCMYYTATDLLRGKTRPDGSTANLSAEDRAICIIGRDRLIKLQTEHFGWLKNECDDRQCSRRRTSYLHKNWFEKASCIPFKQWAPAWDSKLCEDCKDSGKAAVAIGRQKIWDQLPSIFELPPWEDLKE